PGSRCSAGTACTSRGCPRSRPRPGSAGPAPPGPHATSSPSSTPSQLLGQGEREGGALPDRAGQGQLALQHLGQPPADGQPQPRPPVLAGGRIVRLPEVLEHALLVLPLDADA